MHTRTGKFSFFGKGKIARVAIFSLLAAAVLAAAVFVANNQPYGYVAPPALSNTKFSSGNVIAYTPWFENGTYRGDLAALPVSTSGVVSHLTPIWRASSILDAQDFLTGRRIVTADDLGNGIPFRFASLTAAQQTSLFSEAMLNYVRGDRSREVFGWRPRSSVLGDIIHSTPVHVGKPSAGYIFDGYLGFANANAGRAPRVYVGANDGMLHAFDATTGTEVFAYVPSMIMDNLRKLKANPYQHQYFVDGFLTVEDARFNASWHTVLVGGLGAGGRGYFGLDITNAGAATELAAAGKILWEFHSGSSGGANLGFSYSRPSIVKLNNGEWAAVVANGYLSVSGVASLYLLNVETGAVIRELVVPDAVANGLSSPTLIDIDADGLVDSAYAGDLNGNLWKFDLTQSSSAGWSVAFAGQPLFRTALLNGRRQAITTAPEVGSHPEGGAMVYIGTGRLFTDLDAVDQTTQAVYGIWDNNWAAATMPISSAQLLDQQLKGATHFSGAPVRVTTAHVPDWASHRGWMTPVEILGAASTDRGERVLQDLLLSDSRISFMSVNPTSATGGNWLLQLDALTGGAPPKTIIDINGDFALNIQDNVDGDGDGTVTDTPLDRVVGQYQSFGLASRPVVGVLDAGSNSVLINHMNAISPASTADPKELGLVGGHFDVDTSHLVYPFDSGATDGHVHQWDDQHNLTSIDYLNLPDGGGNPLHEINDLVNAVDPNSVFMLTVANDNLSPGGVLEINGASVSVGNYRNLVDNYLAGTGTSLPLFKLNPPTAAEVADGVVQLFSLKMSFDVNAIITGGLLPTETGCLQANTPGALGEYRNGALMVQALDASNVSSGFVFDNATQRYIAGSTAIHSSLGYATNGLFWESTVFWHWNGACYGDPAWAPLYEDCVVQGNGGCGQDDDEDTHVDAKDDLDPLPIIPPPPPPPVVEADPGHDMTNTTVGGTNDTGRLFWKELVPQE